jgi:predicted NBD/HSP70 family sugar kinase
MKKIGIDLGGTNLRATVVEGEIILYDPYYDLVGYLERNDQNEVLDDMILTGDLI